MDGFIVSDPKYGVAGLSKVYRRSDVNSFNIPFSICCCPSRLFDGGKLPALHAKPLTFPISLILGSKPSDGNVGVANPASTQLSPPKSIGLKSNNSPILSLLRLPESAHLVVICHHLFFRYWKLQAHDYCLVLTYLPLKLRKHIQVYCSYRKVTYRNATFCKSRSCPRISLLLNTNKTSLYNIYWNAFKGCRHRQSSLTLSGDALNSVYTVIASIPVPSFPPRICSAIPTPAIFWAPS